MKTKYLLILPLLFLSLVNVCAQTQLRYNNYIINPYLYLPSAAGQDGSRLFFGVRKQWLGVNGSPSSAMLSYDTPYGNNFGMGGQFAYQSYGPLSDMSVSATGNYKLLINNSASQFFNFALSGGVRYSSFDFSASTDAGDPLYSSLPDNEWNGLMKIGVSYSWESFQAFASVPNLLGASSFIFDGSEIKAGPLNQWLVGAKYALKPNAKMTFTPQLIYHGNDVLEDLLEIILIFDYQKRLTAGVSYQNALGLGLLVGFTVSNDLMISYAFEEGNFSGYNRVGYTTHELGFSMEF